MHDIPRLLVDLALALGTAAITTLVSRRLKLPVIVGYLLAGLLIGPYVVGSLAVNLESFSHSLAKIAAELTADKDNIMVMAELGVILIMFGIGLEFSIKKVVKAGPTAFLMAFIQASCVMLSGIVLGKLLGWKTVEGVFLGAGMIATSTVVIVKLFEECRPSKELREVSFSVTIVHDLIAIVLLTLLASYAKVGVGGLQASDLFWTVVKFMSFLIGVVGIGRFFIPQFLRKLADQEKAENLVIASIGFCFSLALLAAASGLSLAIGAFAAGMLASESGRAKKIETLIMPVRDIFTALFFVSVGMMIVPVHVFNYIVPILLFVLLVIIANAVSLTAGGLFTGHTFRTSFQASIALGQFGEFAFVMMTIGIAAGMVRSELLSVAVSVAVITALTSSVMFKKSGRVVDAVEERMPGSWRANLAQYQIWAGSLRHRGIRKGEGRLLTRSVVFMVMDWLAIIGLTVAYGYINANLQSWVVDLNMNNVSLAVAHTSLAVLLGIGVAFMVLGVIKRGRILAVHLAALAPNPEEEGAGRGGRHILAGGLMIAILMAAGLPLIAILQNFFHLGWLFFVSLAVFALVMLRQILLVRRLSKDTPIGMEWLFSKLSHSRPHGHSIADAETTQSLTRKQLFANEKTGEIDLDRTGAFRIIRLDHGSPAVGRQLSRLGLAERVGVTVVALLREGQTSIPLHPSPTLQANDRLVMAGTEKTLNNAEEILVGHH